MALSTTRWVVEASVTTVVVDDPDMICTVDASSPVSAENSDCRSVVMMVRRETTVVSVVDISVRLVT